MGSPKPLLPWRGATLIEYQIEQLLAGGVDEVIAVLGYRHEEIAPKVKGTGARYFVNDRYRQGKTTSIIAGVKEAGPGKGDLLFLGVDQPCPSWVTRRLIEAHRRAGALISCPYFAGRRGHPNIFSRTLYKELERVTDEGQGIREVIARHAARVNAVEYEDEVVLLDLNRPEDYEDARRKYGT